MCGEKYIPIFCGIAPRGSPPRVRGKELLSSATVTANRITPACAGKRADGSRRQKGVQDHPRVCGEKFTSARASSLPDGSPPRVRGKVA